MKHPIMRNAVFCGAITTLAIFASMRPAHAQFVNLVQGNPQSQLTAVSTPDAGALFIASRLDTFGLVANGETLSGSVLSAVYTNSTGSLDFLYQISVTTTTGGVTGTNLNDFSGFSTAAAFDKTDSFVTPAGTFTSGGKRPFGSQRVVGGGSVAFAFNSNDLTAGGKSDGVLLSGDKSAILIVRTNATNYVVANNATVNAAAAANVTVLAPETGIIVVPEAGTLVLLVPGTVLGAMLIKRRRK